VFELVGSSDVPELQYDPVEFDPEKFLSDTTKNPEKVGSKGGKGGEKNAPGKWEDGGNSDKGAPKHDPKGGGAGSAKKMTPKEKFYAACDEIDKMSQDGHSMNVINKQVLKSFFLKCIARSLKETTDALCIYWLRCYVIVDATDRCRERPLFPLKNVQYILKKNFLKPVC
jgi:hypothetical protein